MSLYRPSACQSCYCECTPRRCTQDFLPFPWILINSTFYLNLCCNNPAIENWSMISTVCFQVSKISSLCNEATLSYNAADSAYGKTGIFNYSLYTDFLFYIWSNALCAFYLTRCSHWSCALGAGREAWSNLYFRIFWNWWIQGPDDEKITFLLLIADSEAKRPCLSYLS